MNVPTMAEMMAQGKQPEVLFWVGSAGSYDDRAKKITRSFVKILQQANVDFAVLGTEESSTGDAAKRVGNEFLFQMQAMMNIEILNAYEVKTIVTCDPHSYNTIKNEYPSLGGKYEVFHHTQFIKKLIDEFNEVSAKMAEPMSDDEMEKAMEKMGRLQDQIDAVKYCRAQYRQHSQDIATRARRKHLASHDRHHTAKAQSSGKLGVGAYLLSQHWHREK